MRRSRRLRFALGQQQRIGVAASICVMRYKLAPRLAARHSRDPSLSSAISSPLCEAKQEGLVRSAASRACSG